jgi:hypothetical protein
MKFFVIRQPGESNGVEHFRIFAEEIALDLESAIASGSPAELTSYLLRSSWH